MSKQIVAVDSQKLESIESCMYQFKLRFGLDTNYKSKVTPEYYEKGDLVHKMLETYYKLKVYKSRWIQNKKSHLDIVQACINIARHRAIKMSLDISEVESAIHAFIDYTDYWENDDWNNIAFVEKTGSKVLYDSSDLTILYEVKIDLGLHMSGIKDIVPVDHKTAKSRKDPNKMSNQFRGYCWFLGVNNLIVNEVGFQKTLAPKDKFRRNTLSFSDSQLKEWKENAIYWIVNAVGLMNKNIYPQNPSSCDKYSGCMFKENVCSQDPEIREFKLIQFFENHQWDVGRNL